MNRIADRGLFDIRKAFMRNRAEKLPQNSSSNQPKAAVAMGLLNTVSAGIGRIPVEN